ncbi:putative alanine racemase-domain-containing protein [Phellopilus nigrolimitatus]|nr:putative alanine racemase-domain-containing protein [Phellopilus nigrolimitatus]
MVSSSLVDSLASPADELKELYKSTNSDDNFPETVFKHFSTIPSLDVEHPPHTHAPRSLVCFRAMVQDTSCSPEMYLSSLNGVQCGGWGLEDDWDLPEQLEVQHDFTRLKERGVLWAINIPGEGYWGTRCADITTPTDTSSSGMLHKFPNPGSMHIAVQVKIYDPSINSMKPTDVYIFVGILLQEPVHSELLPDGFITTLHVLFHRTIQNTVLPSPTLLQSSQTIITRNKLIDWLSSEALGGDRDAAEWVLLCCIASVESRNPPLFPPSLTLSNFGRPSINSIPALSHVLSEVLPLYFLLPLSLDLLNRERFEPESKDEDLHSGFLQVPFGTTMVVTEHGVEEGTLLEKGLRNVQALQDVTRLQTLRYNFPFNHYSFPTDIRFITLTDGGKSLFFETNINVRLRPDASSDLYKSKSSIIWPSPAILSAFRELIVCGKNGNVIVDDALSQQIKNEFVQERQENRSVTPNDLVRRMTLARLISLSRCENQMSADTWTLAKDLDNRRKSRIL